MTGWMTKPPAGVQIDWTNPITSGLVLCHLFNEGAGLRANDLSGNGNHGVLTGFEPFSATSGWIGHGLTFDGVNDYVNAGNGASLNITNAITISLWIYPIDQSNSPYVFSRGYLGFPGSRSPEALFSTNYIKFYFSKDGTTLLPISIDTPSTVINNKWSHVVFTYDGTYAKAYADGILGTNYSYPGSIFESTRNLMIGRAQATSNPYFNGSIAGVRIWNRALSASEIQQLYAQPYAMFKSQTANILKMIT